MTAPESGAEVVRVELVSRSVQTSAHEPGVQLTGPAASAVIDGLGSVARTGLRLRGKRRVLEGLYRVEAPSGLAAGLRDETLRWATPGAGDASVQIKSVTTGKDVGRGVLRQAKPSLTSVMKPIAFQAMAVATQQHYLTEISGKLTAIDRQTQRLLERDDDEKIASFAKARDLAAEVRGAIASGAHVSRWKTDELHEQVRLVDGQWRELHRRTEEALARYRQDRPGSAQETEEAWHLLLLATRGLTEASAALSALPLDSTRERDALAREEQARVHGFLARLADLAGDVHAVHASRQADETLKALDRTRNPFRLAKAKLDRSARAERPLDRLLAATADELSRAPSAPEAFLVEVRRDGDVVLRATTEAATT